MGERCTVACKLPHGMILRLFEKVSFDQPVGIGSTQKAEKYVLRRDAKPVRVFGVAKAIGVEPHCLIVAGAALTTGVDKDFMDAWLDQNPNHPAVVNRMIFVHSKQASVQAEAKELRKERSGQEPLEKVGDPRVGADAMTPAPYTAKDDAIDEAA